MLKQDFTFNEFLYLVRRGDYLNYFKSELAEEYPPEDMKNELLQQMENNLNIGMHTFPALKAITLKKKTAYVLEKIKKDKSNLLERLTDDFILRKANKNLRRVYGVRQADRFKIIKNVQNLLSEKLSFHVCKTDIRQFYESIDSDKILKDMNDSSILSFDTKRVLEQLFCHSILQQNNGLPRGINISATLSEYYMRSFDKNIRKIDGFFYYARYVDDIIIFSTKQITKATLKQISKLLPAGLQLNIRKTQVVEFVKGHQIHFLGYQFRKNNDNKLETTIAPSKVKKIKERLVKAFLAFMKDRDFRLLKDRLLFLSANYPLKTPRQELSKYENTGYLHGGIAYNYSLIDDFSCLRELDTFVYKIIFTTAFDKINRHLTPAQKSELQKYSFYTGYQRRITRWFNLSRLSEITKCWG
jgi:hypothetical protein